MTTPPDGMFPVTQATAQAAFDWAFVSRLIWEDTDVPVASTAIPGFGGGGVVRRSGQTVTGAAGLERLARTAKIQETVFLGTRAEIDDQKRLAAIEYKHIEEAPEGEREEIRQIYREKGFEGEELEKAVELITSDKDRWVQTMLVEEYGLPAEVRSPWLAAGSTFSAFIICGLVPLVPYLIGWDSSFLVACIMTGVTFFLIGSFKSVWSTHSWLRSGAETLFIGALAAGLAYGIGVLLKDIAGV